MRQYRTFYLSTTHDEAKEKYLNDAKKNTHPECWSYVQDILEIDLAINQFCPSEWTGMKIDPINIEFTPEFQTLKEKGFPPKGSKAFVNERMKPACNNICTSLLTRLQPLES